MGTAVIHGRRMHRSMTPPRRMHRSMTAPTKHAQQHDDVESRYLTKHAQEHDNAESSLGGSPNLSALLGTLSLTLYVTVVLNSFSNVSEAPLRSAHSGALSGSESRRRVLLWYLARRILGRQRSHSSCHAALGRVDESSCGSVSNAQPQRVSY